MRFRSKPTEIEAEQFLEHNPLPFYPLPVVSHDGERWYVTTFDGKAVNVQLGQWIILENPGDPEDDRAYPCSPEVFARKYEPVP